MYNLQERNWKAKLADICHDFTGKPQARFYHAADPVYAASYWVYLYSEILSTDIWQSVFSQSPVDPVQYKRYRDIVLEPGGSQDWTVLLKNFLGRQPDARAWEERMRLKEGSIAWFLCTSSERCKSAIDEGDDD